MKFHQLTVTDIRKETADCVSVAFRVPAEAQAQFQFVQGQYLTLRTWVAGEELRRSYSICTSPLDQELRVAIKKVPQGKFSTFANEALKVGDSIDVLLPMGRFGSQIQLAQAQTYVAFAAGSGITPIMSILKTVLQREPDSHFCLVYGNKNRSSIIFKAELEALKNRFMGRLSVHHVLSREMADAEVLRGRIDEEKCRLFLQKLLPVQTIDHCFICGPAEMIQGVKQALLQAGIEAQKIHFELFGSPTLQRDTQVLPLQDIQQSKVEIRMDGTSVQLSVPYYGDSILETALHQGADLPFACKGGVCCTCRAKVLSGEVHMDVNYALEADELAAGFVLTCQSHPRSEHLVLDYDAK